MTAEHRAAYLSRALLIPLAIVVLATSAVAQPRERTLDVAAAIERATTGLDVSASQRSDLDRIASRYAGAQEPGIMWRVADEVRAVLTPDQIARLQQRPARAEGRRRGAEGRMMRREDGMRREGARRERAEGRMMRPEGERRRRGAGRGVAPEHRDAARAAMERHREQLQALHAEHEAGRLDDAAFADRARAIHERMRSDMEVFLTPEARQRREDMAAVRERAQASRDEVLRLSPEQREAFRHRAPSAGRRDRADDNRFDALTADQRATMAVHRALVRGARHDGVRGRDRERGERRMRRADR